MLFLESMLKLTWRQKGCDACEDDFFKGFSNWREKRNGSVGCEEMNVFVWFWDWCYVCCFPDAGDDIRV